AWREVRCPQCADAAPRREWTFGASASTSSDVEGSFLEGPAGRRAREAVERPGVGTQRAEAPERHGGLGRWRAVGIVLRVLREGGIGREAGERVRGVSDLGGGALEDDRVG